MAGGLPNGSIATLQFLHAHPGSTEDDLLAGVALERAELFVVIERFEKAKWIEFAGGRYTLTERGAWTAAATIGE